MLRAQQTAPAAESKTPLRRWRGGGDGELPALFCVFIPKTTLVLCMSGTALPPEGLEGDTLRPAEPLLCIWITVQRIIEARRPPSAEELCYLQAQMARLAAQYGGQEAGWRSASTETEKRNEQAYTKFT